MAIGRPPTGKLKITDMKKLLFIFASALLVTSVSLAQEGKKKEATQQHPSLQKPAMISECCMMKDGKMVHYKDGKETVITKEMEMHGMKIMPDGTCKMKNGKSVKLAEGECCDTKGMVHKDCQKMLKKG